VAHPLLDTYVDPYLPGAVSFCLVHKLQVNGSELPGKFLGGGTAVHEPANLT
jgi:hypothetical protein